MAFTASDTIRAIISAAKGVAGDNWMPLAQAMLSVAWMESGFNPRAVGDGGTSFGIFQLHYGGQADAFVAKYGHDALYDPYKQALYKASSMYAVFKDLGGAAALANNPGYFINEFEWITQRPAEKPGYDRSLAAYNTSGKALNGDWTDIPPNTDPISPTTTDPNTDPTTTTDPFTPSWTTPNYWQMLPPPTPFFGLPSYGTDPAQLVLSGLGRGTDPAQLVLMGLGQGGGVDPAVDVLRSMPKSDPLQELINRLYRI